MLKTQEKRARPRGAARGRGQKGLDPGALVERALEEIERTGLEAFSLRQAARASACDPSALIYRFGSKEGLERAIADLLHTKIARLDPKLPWRERLHSMARQYRDLAHRYPRTFPLLTRYWTTGPKELAVAEDSYQALAEAGIPAAEIPSVDCGLYAAILGLSVGEMGGLIGRPTAETLAEIEREGALAMTRRILPAIRALDPDQVFEITIEVLLDGIASRGQRSLSRSSAARRAGPPRKPPRASVRKARP